LAQIQNRYEELVFPDPPRNITSVPDDGQITLNWEAPLFDGVTPITNYRIYRGTSTGSLSFIYEVGNVFTYTDISLTNGQTYYYEITAVNSAGESAPSNQTSATPAVTPSSPRDLTATFGDRQVQLNWLVPATDGGSAVSGYRVYGGTTSVGKALLIELGTTLTYTHTNLTNGQVYYYSVSALNTNGEGPNSTDASATPMAPPSPPPNLQVQAGNGYCHLTWSASTDDGGSPVTNYTIYRSTTPGSGTELITLGSVLAYNDTNVINNQTYYYTVRATNAAGSGTASSEATATPSYTPTAPADTDGGIPSYIWILILLVIILLAIILVFLARRKGEEFERHPTEWEPATPAAVPSPPPDEPGPTAIDMGRNNLFLTENVDTTFKTFNGIINEGSPGLCLTNRYPENLRSDFGLESARIIWFSETGRGEDIYKPQRLEFEITKTTTQFIRDNDEPVILIDGLDYLILRNGFERVSTFLKKITDVAAMERATLVVIVRPDALNQEHVSYLKGQFDRVS
jgi:fibronectin type 3 domain-containing protein